MKRDDEQTVTWSPFVSSKEHDVLTLAYGNAGSGMPAASGMSAASGMFRCTSGRVLLIRAAFVGIASSRNARCA